MKQSTLQELEKERDSFNAHFKIGDSFKYHAFKGSEKSKDVTTRTEASILGGHSVVVWTNEVSGCLSVNHLVPLECIEVKVNSKP